MKILLDEHLDHRLRLRLAGHEVFTVSFMGWNGLKNGELLGIAEAQGIDVFVTGDQTLRYEQNLDGRQVAIVVLSTVEFPILRDNISVILAAIERAEPGSFQSVDCGHFQR